MKSLYLLPLVAVLALGGCSGSEDDEEAAPTPATSADGESAPPPVSAPPPSPAVAAPPVGAPGDPSTGGSAVALPPVSNSLPVPSAPSATGSLAAGATPPPSNFDTDKFISQGKAPVTSTTTKVRVVRPSGQTNVVQQQTTVTTGQVNAPPPPMMPQQPASP